MAKIEYRMIGICTNCGREFVRPLECTHAACDCESAILVPLYPALILPPRMRRRFEKIADQANVSLERLINAVLEEGLKFINKMSIKEVFALE